MKGFKSIAREYALLATIVLLIILMFAGSAFWITSHVTGDGHRINEIGRGRMLCFKIAWTLNMATHKNIVEAKLLLDHVLNDLVPEVDSLLGNIRHGNEEKKITPLVTRQHEHLISDLGRLEEQWQVLIKPLIRQSVKALYPVAVQPTITPGADLNNTNNLEPLILQTLNTEINKFVEQIDRFNAGLVENYEDNQQNFILVTCLLIGVSILLFIGMFFMVRQLSIVPIRTISRVTRQIARGDLASRIQISNINELGTLADNFNVMADKISTTIEDINSRKNEVELMNRMAQTVSQTIQLEEVLQLALDEILTMPSPHLQNKGAIFLYNQKREVLQLTTAKNFKEEHRRSCNSVKTGQCLCGLAASTKKIITSLSSVEDKRHVITHEGIVEHGHIILPLTRRNKILGVLCLYLISGTELGDREIEFYKTICDIIAIHIDNCQTFQEVQRLAQALNSSQDLIIITDTEGRIIHANPMADKYLGYRPAELFDKPVSIMQSPGNPKGLSEEIFAATKQGGWQGEIISISRDGREYPVFLTTAPVYNETGNIVAVVSNARDITVNKKTEQELEQYRHHLEEIVEKRTTALKVARRQAEAANQAKSEFLANMSHELRTPLNAIIGFADLLHRGMAGELAEEQKEYIVDISASGNHLLSLINDILDLSKVEAGKMELDLTEFHIVELIEQSLVMFKEEVMKHKIKVAVEGDKDLPPIMADARKIKQVIFNLLSNAIKFTDDGGSVMVKYRLVNGKKEYIEIIVTDTGIGISPEEQARLFQPFIQLDHYLTKKSEGTGLGLALCRSFVELHNGRIWVESTIGEGSFFGFTIPVGQELPEEEMES